MIRKNLTQIAIVASSALATAFSAPAVTAQTISKSASSSRSIGSSNWGASYYARAYMAASGPRARSQFASGTLTASGTLRVFGRRVSIARFSGTGYANQTRTSARVFASVGPWTLLNKSIRSGRRESTSRTYSYPVFNKTFMVGPIPVNVKARVGVGAYASARLTMNRFPASVGVSASSSLWAHGSASAGVGVSGARAGIEAIGRFGTQSLSAGITATAGRGISGRVRHCSTAVDLRLNLFAEVGVWKLKKKWSTTVARYATRSSCRTLIQM